LFGEILADFEVGEVITHRLVPSVLLVDLPDLGVLGVVCRENARLLSVDRAGGIRLGTINETANDEHGE